MSQEETKQHVLERLQERYQEVSPDKAFSLLKRYIKRNDYSNMTHIRKGINREIIKVSTWNKDYYLVYEPAIKSIITALTKDMAEYYQSIHSTPSFAIINGTMVFSKTPHSSNKRPDRISV